MIVLRLKENQKVYNIQDYNLEIFIKTCLGVLESIHFLFFLLEGNKIEGTPILKLAMVKRSVKNFVKNFVKKFRQKNSSNKFVKKLIKKIRQKIRQ